MKRSHRALILVLPLAGLSLLLLSSPPVSGPPPAAPVTMPAAPGGAEAAAPSVAAAVPAPPLKLPPAGQVWTFTGKVEGDSAGLREGLAAASRGKNLLPAGRRLEVGAFPNLRNLEEGEHLTLSLPDGRSFDGRVNWSRRDEGYANTHQVAIGFTGDKGGLVAIDDQAHDRIQGRLLVEGDKLAWTLEQDANRKLWLVEHLREDMVCEMPAPVAAARANPLPGDSSVSGSGTVPPKLNSRDYATATLYIDFDGEPRQSYADWPCPNPGSQFVVPHSGLTADQMTFVWRRVAEDYIPFNINVSTELAKYNAAPVGRRMRILIGNTLPSCAGTAGLALLRSFQPNSTTGYGLNSRVPCWLATSAYGSPSSMTGAEFSSMASNITHEFGHTLALLHDGNDGVQPTIGADGNYYGGHGSSPFDWSPIMGSPYRSGTIARGVIQWAKNNYPGANNAQDDLAIITGPDNGFGYTADENGGYITASILAATGTANQVGGEGVIMNRADLDWWLFTVKFAGSTTIEVAPADADDLPADAEDPTAITDVSLPNLDCGFRIENNLGNIVADGFSFQDNLEAKTTLNLAPGIYHVVTYGTSNRSATTGGYSDYGSLGRYLITVDLPPDIQDPDPVILSPTAGTLSSTSLTFSGTARDNDRVSGFSLHLRRNGDGAFWNGQYWQVGSGGIYWNGTDWQPGGLARSLNATTGEWNCTSPLPQVGGGGPASLNAGSYDFIAIAEDPAGRSKQATVTVTVDSNGPAVNVGSPSVTLSAANYAFSGTVQDANGVQAVNCFVRRDSDGQYWNGTGWGAPSVNLGSNHVSTPSAALLNWACTGTLPQPGTGLTQGTYTFIAMGFDNLGFYTQRDAVVLIDDNQPPQVTVTTPPHNSFVSSLSSIGGMATDMSGIQGGQVTFTLYQVSSGKFWSGANWVNPITVLQGTVSGNNWTFSAMPQGPFLTAGQYLISSNARDNAGTLSQPVSGVNQTSFRVELDPPAVTITTPLDGTTISSLPAIGGTARDTSGIATVRLYLLRYSDGLFWTGTAWGVGGSAILATQVTGESWINLLPAASLPSPGSNPLYNLTNDSYDIIAIAVDNAGNEQRTDSVVSVQLEYTWTGATLRDANPNNNSNSWDTADNWSPNGVPGSEDKVIIANGDRVDSSVSRTVYGLQLAAGHLNFTVAANGTLTTTNVSSFTGGTFTGIWENLPGADLTISGNSAKDLYNGGILNNSGTVNWSGASLRGLGGCTINNLSGGRYRFQDDGTPFSNYNAGNVFNNAGTLSKPAGTGTTTLNQWTYNNTGAVVVNSGTLQYATTTTFGVGTGFSGTGQVVVTGNTSVTASFPISIAGLTLAAGTHTVTAGVEFSGVLEWTGGTIAGTLGIPSGSTLNITGDSGKDLYNGGVLNNAGTINWSGAVPLRGLGGSTINNLAGGVYRLNAEGTPFSNYNAGNVFNNAGTFIKASGSATAVLNQWTYNNSSAVQVNSGTLRYDSAANFTAGTEFSGAGQVIFNSAISLQASIPVFTDSPGSLTIVGGTVTVSPGVGFTGVLTWTGGTIAGELAIPLGSTLNITGSAAKDLYNGAVLNNSGTINWSGAASLRGLGGCTINNLAGGVYRLESDGTPFSNLNAGNVFNNAGSFIKEIATGTAVLNQWTYNNSSAVQISSGTLQYDSTANFAAGTAFSGAGQLILHTNIALQSTIPFFTGTTGNATFTGGTLTVTDGVGFTGTLTWTAGTIAGILAIPPSSTLNITGAGGKDLFNGAVLNNAGTINWDGVPLRGLGSCTINNLAGGVYRLNADGTPFSNNNGGNVFNNAGTLIKTTGDAIAVLNQWTYHLAAPVQVDAGTVRFDSATTFNTGTGFSGAGHIVLNSTITMPVPFTTTAASFTMIGGTLTASPGAGVIGTLHWNSGTVIGTLAVPSGSTLNLTGTGGKDLYNGAVLNNSGTINWDGASLRGLNTCTINNLAGGVYRLNADGTPFSNNNGGNVFNNAGTLIKTAGLETALLNLWTCNFAAPVRVDSGTLRFEAVASFNSGTVFSGAGQVVLNGTIAVPVPFTTTAASFTMIGGTLTATAGAGVTGTLHWTGGTLHGTLAVPFGSTLNITGAGAKDLYNAAVLNNAGTVNWDGASLRGLGGCTVNNLTGGVYQLNADGTPLSNYNTGNVFNNAGSFLRASGTGTAALNQWTFNNSSRIISNSGLLDFSALLNLNDGGFLQGTAPMSFSSGQCNLRGTTTQQSPLFSFVAGTVSGHADLTGTLAGGRWDWTGGTWSGVINVATGGNLFITGATGKDLYNGAVLANAGTVTYDAAGSLRGLGGSSIHNKPGATFVAASTAPLSNYNGGNFFTNDGTVTIGPALSQWTLHWSYTQSATGALNIEIAGPTPAEFDRLAVAGTATLGGTVSVTKLGGYAPAEGTTFPFLTAGSVSGTFGIITGGFTGTYTATTATLRAAAAGQTFEQWLAASGFTAAEIANPLITGPNADPDGDGLTNFFEYVHNTNPRTGSGAPQQASLVEVGGQPFLALKYRRWADREAAGVTYTPQTGTSLDNWGTTGIIEEVDPDAPVIPGSTACRCRVPIAAGQEKFLRVKAAKP